MEYALQIHKAYASNALVDRSIADDIDMFALCETFHVLPWQIDLEDADWITKFKIILHERAEEEKREAKRRDK